MENIILNEEILQVGVKEYSGNASIESVRAVSLGPVIGRDEIEKSGINYQELTQDKIDKSRGLEAKSYLGKMSNKLEEKLTPSILKDGSGTKVADRNQEKEDGIEL